MGKDVFALHVYRSKALRWLKMMELFEGANGRFPENAEELARRRTTAHPTARSFREL